PDPAELERQRAQWRAELAGVPELAYPGRPAPGASAVPRSLVFPLGDDVSERVDRCAAAHGTTPYAVLLAAYGRALAELCGQDDLAVGTPVALRGDPGLEGAVTCLIDVVCMRLRFDREAAGPADLTRVAATVRAAFGAQDVPFGEVVELVNPPRGARPPLFQNMFALQNNASPVLALPGARAVFERPEPFGLPTELVAEVRPGDGGGARLVVGFRPDRVPDGFAARLGAQFMDALDVLTLPHEAQASQE
ncbi:condensation domain-containing protein, partial [Kitasatospora sp. NPDC047058]|uniref:condensation domain-containing protein n=1 Tax=Kitasatospora sp. NPDC047058 TaxID=3155620 RepID=UPI0033EE991F